MGKIILTVSYKWSLVERNGQIYLVNILSVQYNLRLKTTINAKNCGLKSQVVLKYRLISIIKHYLIHKEVVLSQRVVSQQNGL